MLLLLLSLAVSGAAPAPIRLGELAAIDPVMNCEALAGRSLGEVAGTAARVTEAKTIGPTGREQCRVRGLVAPAIRFELYLPQHGWTQRYVQSGCGGLCGTLRPFLAHAETCGPVRSGELAVGGSDMGHDNTLAVDDDGRFGHDPQKRIDFAYRGVHATALTAKATIALYYGRPVRYAYFSGCSDGGREALVEAERFPRDFDGIAAGAPALEFQVQNTFYHGWQARSNTGPDGLAILTADKLPILHAAALAACHADKDGVIADPRACRFDPAVTLCASGTGDRSACLEADQVEAARRLYGGPRDARGHRFTIGGPQVGSELAWRGVYVPQTPTGPIPSEAMAMGTIMNLAFVEDPPAGYRLSRFAFDQATFRRLAAYEPLFDATDTDLAPFARAGGKLIVWHGWSDPHISPINTIAWYQGVERRLGKPGTARFSRLFLIPGLYHCAGGEGRVQFDVLTPLMTWVERGAAPEALIVGRPGRQTSPPTPPAAPYVFPAAPLTDTRPVFAFPAIARYSGHGDPGEAASYVAGPPPPGTPPVPDWEGARFLEPDHLVWCSAVDDTLKCGRRPSDRRGPG